MPVGLPFTLGFGIASILLTPLAGGDGSPGCLVTALGTAFNTEFAAASAAHAGVVRNRAGPISAGDAISGALARVAPIT